MVVATSPQPNELEQKKKRQTLERAKASHLSKQLQMRLQYAKLKVEHGWQRQNLNEVENLYFHHSHLRSIRGNPAVAQRPQYTVVAYPQSVDAPLSPIPDQLIAPSSVDGPESQSPSDPTDDLLSATTTTTPPMNPPLSALDLSDPSILARLVQLQAQVQSQSQSQSLALSQPQPLVLPPAAPTSTPVSPPASHTAPTSLPASVPVPISVPLAVTGPASATFPPHPTHHPHLGPGIPFTTFPQPFLNTGSVLYSIPIPTTPSTAATFTSTISTPLPHHPAISTQPPVPIPMPTTVPTTASSAPIPTPPIAPTALTYDSFWSTHASSTGPTRALYRTAGFTASATPAGNVAMLTPGGHAAIMTAEGVYVGGATSKTS